MPTPSTVVLPLPVMEVVGSPFAMNSLDSLIPFSELPDAVPGGIRPLSHRAGALPDSLEHHPKSSRKQSVKELPQFVKGLRPDILCLSHDDREILGVPGVSIGQMRRKAF